MQFLGLGRFRNLDLTASVQRYQWEMPGNMTHVDIEPQASAKQ
jgi:hypothetical protein